MEITLLCMEAYTDKLKNSTEITKTQEILPDTQNNFQSILCLKREHAVSAHTD